MRLVFIGSSKFGLKCLEHIAELPGIDVVGIITNPENFSISYNPQGVRNVLHANFHFFALRKDIPLWNMNGNMSEPGLIGQLRNWAPEFILVVGWYHKIPKSILSMAPVGGLHASLLPDYSGGAPLVWAIMYGEEKTGISFFLMDDSIDSGPIIGQVAEPIYFEDTIATLYQRIEEAGLKLLEQYLPRIARGDLAATPQDETKRRLMPQRSPEDGEIDWDQPALNVYNFIRAQTKPYPGAFTFLGKSKLFIWKSNPLLNHQELLHPGEVSSDRSRFIIGCGQGAMEILLLSHDGGEMNGEQFRRLNLRKANDFVRA